VKTYGLVIVKLNDGTELLIPFVDQMYFENIPDTTTGPWVWSFMNMLRSMAPALPG
jgi:hypothetical protein